MKTHSVKYKIAVKPGTKLGEKQYGRDLFYPRFLTNVVNTTTDIAEEAHRCSTVTLADAYAVFTSMREFFETHLRCGEVIKLEGIGTFKPRISGELENIKGQLPDFKNLKVEDITFIPDKSLLRIMSSSVFETQGVQHIKKVKPEVAAEAINEYLENHDYVTSTFLMEHFKISRQRSRALLRELVNLNILQCVGSGSMTHYVRQPNND